MNILNKLHWFICPLFLLACARQTTPTGGPKDTIPPILLRAIPANEQTNYKASTLELTFNEMLLLNNPKEQIIIIPDVGKDFDAQIKKNKLILTFDNPLIENTTYSVNFREAIQDITEKNPTENLKLAFSTGDYIDSLSIKGHVYDILKATAIEDATVALYQRDTFDIFKHKPSYFSKSDKEGTFEIANLKPGDYYIYALKDNNKNLIVESKSESYGFLSTQLHLAENIQDVSIPILHLDTRPLNLTSARPSGTYFNIKTSKNLSGFSIKTQSNQNVVSSFGEDQANVRIYNTFSDLDSLQIRFLAHDSIDLEIDTTLYVKFTQRQLTSEKFTATNAGFHINGPKGILKGQINFNKPLREIYYDSMYYQIDSTTFIPITPQDISLDTLQRILTINKTFDQALFTTSQKPIVTNPGQQSKRDIAQPILKAKPPTKKQNKNQLYIAANSFLSVELDSSNQITETVKPTTLQTTGTIIVQIDTDKENFIVQLISRNYTIIESTINTKKTIFENLDPTTYQIRLIIDQNQDRHWTPGNYYLAQQPEPIKFYENEKKEKLLNLKANWELGPLLITY